MENSTFFLTYLLIIVICLVLTVGLIIFINKGLKKYFENLSQDNEIAKFFIRMTNIIILLGGLGAALTGHYATGKDSNWLTITWDAAGQLEGSLKKLFLTLMIFAIAFFILHLLNPIVRRINK